MHEPIFTFLNYQAFPFFKALVMFGILNGDSFCLLSKKDEQIFDCNKRSVHRWKITAKSVLRILFIQIPILSS